MSFLDSFEDRTLSPIKVAWNLAADVLTTGDFPSWKQIDEAFSTHDTSSLPQLTLTNKNAEHEVAWNRGMQAGSVNLSISRVGDVQPADPLTLWRSGD